MTKLISFLTPSRRLDNIEGFFDNIEETASDPSCVEVLVKFDDDQEGVKEFIEREVAKRRFTIKYIITPRLEGIFSVWVAMEQLFFMTDPESYYIMVMSDEPRFNTSNWDSLLSEYMHFFEDDVFRLRLSSMKMTNYATHYECTFRPDSFPIYTRRWLELTEGTGDCWGSDAYQQCVAFQLSLGPDSYTNFYREGGLCRDIVVHNIELRGLEFCVGVSPEDQVERHKQNLKEWNRLTSFQMQEKFSYLARRINCYIWAYENDIRHFKLVHSPLKRTVQVVTSTGHVIHEVSYSVSRLYVYTHNCYRYLLTKPRVTLQLLRMKVLQIYNGAKKIPRTLKTFIKKLLKLSVNVAIFILARHVVKYNSKLSYKKRIKIIYDKCRFLFFLPVNAFFYIFSKIIKNVLRLLGLHGVVAKPPGISVIYTKKPKLPRNIVPPNESQVRWLKSQLASIEANRDNLKTKQFFLEGDIVLFNKQKKFD